MERYNFQVIEKKWQKNIFKKKNFIIKKGKKFYCLRNVSLSIWKNSYGSC